MTYHLGEISRGFQNRTHSRSVVAWPGPGGRRIVAAAALALLVALTLDAGRGYAANYYWVGGSDYWQSPTAWSLAPNFPGSGDNAFFTNAASYSVTLSNGVLNVQSNFFSNASNTTATVTLNLNTYELNPAYTGTAPGAFDIGDTAASTTVVYLASATATGKGLVVPGRIVVGRNGYGTLIVTNGNVSAATTVLANASGGCGLLVLSGPSVFWTNSADLAVGNNSNSFGSTLVVSNSAVMVISGTFRVGSGSGDGGSSNNTLVLSSGAKLYTQSGPITIGNNGTPTSTSPSYNNSATVEGGAVWDNGNSSFFIGYYAGLGAATGNVLTVGVGGVVTNISNLTITSSNTLNMAGGFLSALTACEGTVQGFGTVTNDVSISGIGMLSPFNSLGTLTFAKKLTLSTTTTTTVELGTNSNPTVVEGALTLGGTLNITDGGGFTNGTYTLFTYNSTLSSGGLTIGTTPNSNWTYTIDTNSTPHEVNLVVEAPATAPVADFYANPTAGSAPLTVTFTDTSTGSITNRFWSFGDGGTTNTTATSVPYVYQTTGSYQVSLIVSGLGGSNTNTKPNYIVVGNATPPPPVASFTNNPASGPAPLTVYFYDTSTGSPTGWAWAFGDGNTSTNQNPSDIYLNPGSYTVQQAVTSQSGSATDTVVNLINVYDPFAWWQLQYFGSTNSTANTAPGGDSTGTGMRNTNKFLAGFDPTNSAAYLHILRVAAGNTNVVVTYLGASGDTNYVPGIQSRTNVLDFTTGGSNSSYANDGWQDTGQTNILGVGISAAGGEGTGLGTVTNMTDNGGATNVPSRYYRVRVLLP